MSKTSKQITFDGITLKLEQLPSMKASRFLVFLAKQLGGTVLALMASGEGAVSLEDMDTAEIVAAAQELILNLDEDNFERVVSTLLGNAFIVGENDKLIGLFDGYNFDNTFKGKLASMLKFVWEAILLNYSDFYEGFSTLQEK